jgi:hypothetical protein
MTSAKPAILLLVPDARLRDIYISRFERDGWEVDAASTLLDAERRAVQLRPSVMLVHRDLLENVKAAFQRFKSLPTLLTCRMVVIAKALSRGEIDELLKAGAREVVLTAHLTPQGLVKKMNHLIED